MQIRDRIKEFRRVRASELRPSPHNWREHPKAQRDALRSILAEVGYADACLVRELEDGELEVIDGHLRAETTPEQDIPVLVLDVDEDEAQKLLATHDPLAAMATANREKLAELLRTCRWDGTGSQRLADEIAKREGIAIGGNGELVEDEAPIDQADELLKKWKVETGQLWLIEGNQTHRLLCGDATEKDNWMACDLVVSSPPYPGADMWNNETEHGKSANVERMFALGYKVLTQSTEHAAVVAWNVGDCSTGKAYMLPTGFNVVQWAQQREMLCRWAVWDKGIINPLPPQSFMRRPVVQHITHEWLIIIYPKGWHPREKTSGLKRGTHEWQMRSVWTIAPAHASSVGHKAPFPIRLAERCVSLWSLEGDTVCDPFIGSGTTMAAAEQLGRTCYGIEIAPKYCAVVLERMTNLGCKCMLQNTQEGKTKAV